MRINVDDVALRDKDINRRLPRYAGLSRFDAFGRLIHVWGLAYDQRSSVVRVEDVDDVAEHEGFAAAMVQAEIADRVDDELIRIHGVQERIAYLIKQSESGARGGARAKDRPRNADGSFSTPPSDSESTPPSDSESTPPSDSESTPPSASQAPAPPPDQAPTKHVLGEALDGDQANAKPTSGSSPSPDLPDHTPPSRDRVASLAAEAMTAVRQVAAELAQELGVKFMRGNPMAVEGMARAAVAGWLAVGGEAEVRDCVGRLIAFRSRRALAERHLRFWVEETWWEASGIARDLGQPMDLAERRSRGGDGPGGPSRQPTGAAAGADALEILRRRKQGQSP